MNEASLYDHDNLKCNWSNCWIWLYQADPVTCGSSEFRTLLSNCLAETTSQQLPIINYILCIQGDIDRCERATKNFQTKNIQQNTAKDKTAEQTGK